MKNIIVKEDNFAVMKIINRKGQKFDVIIDIEDVEKVSKHRWYARICSKDLIYIGSYISKEKSLLLHRYLTDCPKSLVVDHINHNTLDNRKQNLRVCSISENNRNKKNYFDENGNHHIRHSKKDGLWYVTFYGKSIGSFYNLEQAKALRNDYISQLREKIVV